MDAYRRPVWKGLLSLFLALTLICSSAAGAVVLSGQAAAVEGIYCHVKYSMPAICCDVGQRIDLGNCAVQFSPDGGMMSGGIAWEHQGETVRSFTPAQSGVYTLTASRDGKTKTIYIVAKNPDDSEYILYRNDFQTLPTDFRVSDGSTASVRDGSYVLDASAQVLLPEFLDDFGDFTLKVSMKTESAAPQGSVIYRTQPETGACYQATLREDTALLAMQPFGKAEQVCGERSFSQAHSDDYNLYTLTAKGTYSSFSVNGVQLLEYANTAFAGGGMGFRANGAPLLVDEVQVILEGNAPATVSADVSFGKPAIRADMGDTIDLTQCDVQFHRDTLYTKGQDITWKLGDREIVTFTPTALGVTALTAVTGQESRTVYVVTRSLMDGEYVLYQNDFDTATHDFRMVQRSGSSAALDGQGHYVLDASQSAAATTKVLLPGFLDDFADFKLEASCKTTDPVGSTPSAALMVHTQGEEPLRVKGYAPIQPRSGSAGTYQTYSLTVQDNQVTGEIDGQVVLSSDEHEEVAGGMGIQVQGAKVLVDQVKVTLGNTTALMDTAVRCYVAKSRPAIGCNVGDTILLSQCPVQFTYGSRAVDGSQITWKKDGNVITEFSGTTKGIHTLTATHGHTTMNVYVVAKNASGNEYVLYSTDFSTSPTDYRVPETTGGARVYPLSGTFVLNASASGDAFARVLLPVFLDQFGDLNLEASIKLTGQVDTSKWGAIMYRVQNSNIPYMQCCFRYNANTENGVEISQRTPDNTWNVLHKASTTSHHGGGYNVFNVNTKNLTTDFYINGTKVLSGTDTPYYNGCWGFHVRGATMTIDYVRVFFTSNYDAASLHVIPGGFVDVRDPSTGISVAPSMITDVKTRAEFDNILTNCPAVAIMNYDVVNGVGKVVFSDGSVTPEAAMMKLGSKVIPAFRIDDTTEADSLAAFLKGMDQRDVYAVSSNLPVLKRAYSKWKYIRGVADYSGQTSFDPETLRYNAWANAARVMILPENTTRAVVTQLQDSYTCVWLTISAGKTATVAGTNKGPYGLITPDRGTTEYCYKNYYGANTLIRRTNVIGHRGVPSMAPENTILGTQTAFNNGADMVENDIYLTADGVVVVMHDETIDRTTNGSGKVVQMTSAQLKRYNVDYYSGSSPQPIPTLEDYFKLIKGKSGQKLVIEMKHPADARLANAMVSMIKKYDILDQVVIMSFIQQNVSYTTAALPGAPVGWLNWLKLDETNPLFSTYETLESIQPYNCVCNPGYSGFGSEVIKELAARGVTLWPWTLNKRDQFDKLFIDGVAGITTDYCHWAKNYIESIHWNSGSRVISSTYQNVLTDITNSCEVVVIEDTLGITTSAGNVIVPQKPEGGKASFYYRYKSTTATGASYYTVTEIRTVEVPSIYTLSLISGSNLALSGGQLTKVTDSHTVSKVKAQFQYPVEILDAEGNLLSDYEQVTTGSVVRLKANTSKKATIIIKGDVNGDGWVNTADYLLVKSYFLRDATFQGPYLTAADCDDSGTIDTVDYMRIRYHILRRKDLYSSY